MPEPDNQRVGILNQGDEVKVSSSVKTKDGTEWKKVESNNMKGYVKASQLKLPID
ncbi:MAG: SH3 domain-containing protein [Methylococcales bacterium]|nr:SH3 domain-containing protein [Methylococcales bacterium]